MPTLESGGRNLDVLSTHRAWIDKYTGPASYVTGGDAFVPGDLKLGTIDFIAFELAIDAAGVIYGLVYDTANEKVIWYVLSTGLEVANGTDLSGFSARFAAFGL